MSTINQVLTNIQNGIGTFAMNNLQNPANIVTALATGLTQVTLGIFITVMAAMLKEVLRPTKEAVDIIGTNIQGQTNALVAKADLAINQRSNLPKIKPDAPEPYDGKPDQVMPFISSLIVYFAALKETNDKNKIMFTLSKIKGGKENIATRWADAKRIEIVNYDIIQGKATATNATPADIAAAQAAADPSGNWEIFTQQLRNHFMLAREDEAA